MVTSPVSQKVAIVYTKPLDLDGWEERNDVWYFESINNGDDWIAGTHWPPNRINVTNYTYADAEFAYMDVAACYDYNDSLHIVWNTTRFPTTLEEYWESPQTNLYHWSKADNIERIAEAYWAGTGPGRYNRNISKPSIAAADPSYYADTSYLYCVWTQFDTLDNAANGYTNGDIYLGGAVMTPSWDSYCWYEPLNLTRTKTPDCFPGDCVSEHWASLAVSDTTLHIQYVCDLDAGAAVQDEGEWSENPMMYLHLTQWPVPPVCRTDYNIEPTSWHQPFLKVPPGGYRYLTLTITNIGCDTCRYQVTSDDPCIDVWVDGYIDPGQEEVVNFAVVGTGDCEGTFIDGNVYLWTSEEGATYDVLPVQAVVAEDYYECPNDSETVDTLENDYLKLYVNANCQEWIYDISTFLSATGEDTTIEVFFQGGTIVATTSEGDVDTVVGRYMGTNDQHAGVRDKLYKEQCDDVPGEPPFWVLYTKNIFMHNLNPPAHDYTWYWWELSKQIKFFKPTAPEVYQRIVIKYIRMKRHDPPGWWPDQPPPRGYQDTYVGVAEDIDCPFDTAGVETGDENGCNYGRYDNLNHIAYQIGFGREHTAYSTYHAGIAMINGGGGPSGEEEAYKTHCVRNNQYLYPQTPWGWKDGELYKLASDISGGRHQIDFGPPYPPDSIVDRTYVVCAQKIDAGDDPNARASFTMVEVVAPQGELQMQAFVDSARAIVLREYPQFPAICGDVTENGIVDLGDIVYLVNYVFRGGPPPSCPENRGDVTSNGIIDLGDIVYLVNFVYRFGPEPDCPGIWYWEP